MKLIQCRIENFGVLSDYTCRFQEGLTVILEPNGSGKSTLAAFIKAMFYGLPAKGPRNVVENERRRYEPWQGGHYGGYLDFSYQGTTYRVTRHFGQTAAKDSFEVRDLTNHKSYTGFSERLGEEIFQLDAESFSRSILISAGNLSLSATNNIRSKLSDLVDHTNDLNNYDTAVSRLRQKRSQYQPYRGAGGAIQKTSDAIERTKQALYDAEGKKQRIAWLEETIAEKEQTAAEKNAVIRKLRQMIHTAATREARLNRKKQLQALEQEQTRFRTQLHELDSRYPRGYPSREETEGLRAALSQMEQAEKDLANTDVSQEDLAVYEGEGSCFSDLSLAREEIASCQEKCAELEAVTAKLNASMVPEEWQRLRELRQTFQEAPPSEEELERLQTLADTLQEKQRRLKDQALTPEELARFRDLEETFAAGTPTDEQIEACEKRQQEIAGYQERKRALALSGEEEAEFNALTRNFTSGVPAESEIRRQQQATRRIAELNGIKQTKTALPPDRAEANGSFLLPLLLGIFGALLAVGAILCFLLGPQTPGIVMLAGGAAAVLTSFWLYFRKTADQQRNPGVMGSAISREENQELYDLQHDLQDFILRFYRTAEDPDKQLTRLFLDREKYQNLVEKNRRFAEERDSVEREIQVRKQENVALFRCYYPDQPYWDSFPNDLMRRLHDYSTLKYRLREQDAGKERLSAEITACRNELLQALAPYDPEPITDAAAGIRRLISDAREYSRLQRKLQRMKEENAGAAQRRAALMDELEEILNRYDALLPGSTVPASVQQLRNRFDRYREAAIRVENFRNRQKAAAEQKEAAEGALLGFFRQYGLTGTDYRAAIQAAEEDARLRENYNERLAEANRNLSVFLRENPDAEAPEPDSEEPVYDLGGLQRAEENLQQETEEIQGELRGLRQEYDALCRITEEIPGLQDRLAGLEESLQRDRTNLNRLDKTLRLLEQAKDQLANSYIGTVEQRFTEYADRLFAGRLGEAMLDPNLQLSVGEQGKQRIVGSFSAGTAEGIMLCMRLALVDALFTGERPFLILDDPFLNLDDLHTSRSLDIIRRLAQEDQVIYLVCNSGRTIGSPV